MPHWRKRAAALAHAICLRSRFTTCESRAKFRWPGEREVAVGYQIIWKDQNQHLSETREKAARMASFASVAEPESEELERRRTAQMCFYNR